MIKQILSKSYNWFSWNFIYKTKYTLHFILHPKKYCCHKSYYPDMPKKNVVRIWFDQFIQTIRFGYPNDFYFPYGFDVKGRREMDEYIHYFPFMKLRDKLNGKRHSATAILRDKLYFGFFTNALGIDSGKNIGVIKGKIVFDLSEKKEVNSNLFFQELKGKYIFKPIDGECGSGIFILDSDCGKLKINNTTINIESLRIKLKENRYLIQEVVCQHPDMARLHPQSLNTIRFVTIRDQRTGEIKPFPSILRIGTGGSFVDNTSQGGLAVAVDLENGKLGKYGYFKPEFGTRTAVHPDSGIKFSEFEIPCFKEAKEQAIKLHSMLPSIHSIGWDIAIGENGPVFIEGNDNWEINGPQICNGPLKNIWYSYKYNKRPT